MTFCVGLKQTWPLAPVFVLQPDNLCVSVKVAVVMQFTANDLYSIFHSFVTNHECGGETLDKFIWVFRCLFAKTEKKRRNICLPVFLY